MLLGTGRASGLLGLKPIPYIFPQRVCASANQAAAASCVIGRGRWAPRSLIKGVTVLVPLIEDLRL